MKKRIEFARRAALVLIVAVAVLGATAGAVSVLAPVVARALAAEPIL